MVQGNGQHGERRPDIFWVGAAAVDPYRQALAGRYTVADYATLYDAIAQVLTGGGGQVLVVNAVTAGAPLARNLKAIIAQGFFQAIVVYSTVPSVVSYRPNGDGRVSLVEHPDQLLARLAAVLEIPPPLAPEPAIEVEKPVVPVEKPKPQEQPNPQRYEPAGLKLDVVVPSPSEDEEFDFQSSSPQPEVKLPPVRKPPPRVETEFKPAELTAEEIQALLGPDAKEK